MKTRITLFVILIMAVLSANAQTPEPAKDILDKAFKQAAAEKKNVIVIFHASWCGWCKKLEASINDPSCKDYFDRSYIIRELTILENNENKKLENPGALDIYNNNGGKNGGVPFFIFYDSKGNILGDSRVTPAGAAPGAVASNMGCPAQESEVDAFIGILKKTSKITDKEVEAVRTRFLKNKSTSGH